MDPLPPSNAYTPSSSADESSDAEQARREAKREETGGLAQFKRALQRAASDPTLAQAQGFGQRAGAPARSATSSSDARSPGPSAAAAWERAPADSGAASGAGREGAAAATAREAAACEAAADGRVPADMPRARAGGADAAQGPPAGPGQGAGEAPVTPYAQRGGGSLYAAAACAFNPAAQAAMAAAGLPLTAPGDASPAAEAARLQAKSARQEGRKKGEAAEGPASSSDDPTAATAQPAAAGMAQLPPSAEPAGVAASGPVIPSELLQQVVEYAAVTQNREGFMEFRLGLNRNTLSGLRVRLCAYGNKRVGLSLRNNDGPVGEEEVSQLIESLNRRGIEVVDVNMD